MMRLSDLPNSGIIRPVLNAHKDYKKLIAMFDVIKREVSYARVFYNDLTHAVIIILPEMHDSDSQVVQKLAEDVASRVMAIPKVKIAVEYPVLYNASLISDVGFSHPIASKERNRDLFAFSPDSKGSISHHIYQKQVIRRVGPTSSRYAAESMPPSTPRYNNPVINRTMANKVMVNTRGNDDISVFPVGTDHVNDEYDDMTLDKHITCSGWKTVYTDL